MSLLQPIRDRDYDTLEQLLEDGADPNTRYDEGLPLTTAIYRNDEKAVSILLKRGADPNIRGSSGTTPLIWTARSSVYSVVHIPRHSEDYDPHGVYIAKMLLEAGADPNLRSDGGGTALMYAVGRSTIGLIITLLGNGADPSIRDQDGRSLYQMCTSRRMRHIIGRYPASIYTNRDRSREYMTSYHDMSVIAI